MQIAVLVTTLFFYWWIVFSKHKKISWAIRPAYAENGKSQKIGTSTVSKKASSKRFSQY